MENTKGFVYILTNKSFRDDWVKIGKSSRPVDVRSKELDNTAVPLPFDIFATIQTSKYAEVERIVHKQIDRLTDLRIRQKREFFNVQPDQALDILLDQAQVLDDAVVLKYEDGKLLCFSAASVNRFPKDRVLEEAWDLRAEQFFRGHGLAVSTV